MKTVWVDWVLGLNIWLGLALVVFEFGWVGGLVGWFVLLGSVGLGCLLVCLQKPSDRVCT